MRGGKVLVTGAGGMLATDLVPTLAAAGHEVVALGRADLDVTDPVAVQAALAQARPAAVVHAAAYTRVDDAEAHPALAHRVNATGAAHVAQAARDVGAAVLYVSTDYVFDGRATEPYGVEAATGPLNAYGRSKLAGEEAVRQTLAAHWIVRTSWLYGRGGPNFVETMRRLARQQPALRVVADQVGSPTWTVHLADAIAGLLASGRHGTYHATGGGHCSWHDLATRTVALEGLTTPVHAITTTEMPRPAARPAWSVLDGTALRQAGVPPLPPWEAALAAYLTSRPWREA
ncbi:MAG: dTDP-4-dehydrorhamnose reductase [Candidatus Sericytochromatia bacterium]|nr:dTDP-4-dehydrorhamnose reductase [Candidatus Sericytochromatia bacterium]